MGVLSLADILVFDRECTDVPGESAYFGSDDPAVSNEVRFPNRAEEVRVGEVMTPAVFSVTPRTPALEVVEEMVRLHVHRMFVVDETGTLVGVVSSLDVLRELVD